MSDDTPGRLNVIGQMISASKTLPDDFFMTAAMQELAGFVARNETRISDEDLSLLVGVGAVLVREGRRELVAEIQTTMLMNSLRAKP